MGTDIVRPRPGRSCPVAFLSPPLLLLVLGCSAGDAGTVAHPAATPAPATVLRAPVAAARPERREQHGHVRVDEYAWLAERDDPEVLAYLEAENAYTEAVMAPTESLQQELVEELLARTPQDEQSVPYALDGYLYYTRHEPGREHPLHCRRRASLEGSLQGSVQDSLDGSRERSVGGSLEGSRDAPEEVLLDVNLLAEGQPFCDVGPLAVSPDGRLLAYTVDLVGRRLHTLHVRDLERGELLPDTIPEVTSNVVWAADSRTLLYTRQDPVTLRWHQVWRHELGTDASRDVLVYAEPDETFDCWVYRTRSRRFLVIASEQTLADEYRVLAADDPDAVPRLLLPRRRGHESDLDHHGEHFYLRTNDGAPDFRLVRFRSAAPPPADWEPVVPARDGVLLEDVLLFDDGLVTVERELGLVTVRVHPWSGAAAHELAFDEPAYAARPVDNHEADAHVLRIAYSSLRTPESILEHDLRTGAQRLLHQDRVLLGFDPDAYVTERLFATAPDGERVPISLLRREDAPLDGTSPLLLYGYGAYGESLDAEFEPDVLSLVDRGFVYALAHVRGGSELGRRWYVDGRQLRKPNSFHDFIACAEHLVELGYTSPERLFALGESAGGLLMGAVANLRPELFAGIIAEVPFVDVINTMLDETIPLTTSEFDEWGDPSEPAAYWNMLSWSPYDQVRHGPYPALLVTAGLHDSQVQYWEPAKWVARLRARSTVAEPLLLRTHMHAGHDGAAGRRARHVETAVRYAFLLDLVTPPSRTRRQPGARSR